VVQQEMTRGNALLGSTGAYLYLASVLANRPVTDYTPRIVPSKEGAFIPLESIEILWQR
jgi:glycogen phosphorylase